MVRYAPYKDYILKDIGNEETSYYIRVFRVNKKSVSCKIAKDRNFDPCSKKQSIKIVEGNILFVNYFKSFPVEELELKDEYL